MWKEQLLDAIQSVPYSVVQEAAEKENITLPDLTNMTNEKITAWFDEYLGTIKAIALLAAIVAASKLGADDGRGI